MYSMFEDKKVPACGSRSSDWQNDRRVPGGFTPIEELVDSSVQGMSAEDLLTGESDPDGSIADAKEYLLYFPTGNGTSARSTIRACRLFDEMRVPHLPSGRKPFLSSCIQGGSFCSE